MISLTKREDLQDLRELAINAANVDGVNVIWARAYIEIADAADRMDAMIARTLAGPDTSTANNN